MKKCFLFIFCVFVANALFAQAFPAKPVPERLFSDFAKMVDTIQAKTIESRLVEIKQSQNLKIMIVSLDSLYDYTSVQYLKKFKKKWGLSTSENKNCAFIFIKPVGEIGQRIVSVEVSKDLDNVLPDSVLMEIVDEIMLPNLRKHNYFEALNLGIDKIVNTIKK